jgi:hypothetical protein
MRTTLQLDNDVLEAARDLAKTEKKSLSEVVSDLARKGLDAPTESRGEQGFPMFEVSPTTPPLTPEMVHRALESCPYHLDLAGFK